MAIKPNFKTTDAYDVISLGKSRTAYFEYGSSPKRRRLVKFKNVTANFNFKLPANVRLHGDIVIFNNSANTQAAITVGTAAAGTQVDAGATTATNTTAIRSATDTGASRSDRTIYVESAAWQTGVSIVFEVTEYPFQADPAALS